MSGSNIFRCATSAREKPAHSGTSVASAGFSSGVLVAARKGLAAMRKSWHSHTMQHGFSLSLLSQSPDQTAALAARLGAHLHAGDVVLLDGPVGAGKSHFCRALIQSRLAAVNRHEDVPSPSFTLVQTYEADGTEIWHADLYRLADPHEIFELGLEDAFEHAICLVEWAERLGDTRPRDALHLRLTPGAGPDARQLDFTGGPVWQARLAPVLAVA